MQKDTIAFELKGKDSRLLVAHIAHALLRSLPLLWSKTVSELSVLKFFTGLMQTLSYILPDSRRVS